MARIRETARLVGRPLEFARAPEEIASALARGATLAIVDLTTPGWDYAAIFSTLHAGEPPPSVLGFTTHVLAAQTKPLHAHCDRVVTKETLTAELADILREGRAA